ncbi:MAG TPA: hypothetical protein ENN81_02085 [Phycisphaerales bacterium]|nr:hypothetical protein [Phycisphaerales bacterium]
MAYKRLKGIPGRIHIPDIAPAAAKKHPCPDCFQCQHCPDDRCRTCLKSRNCKDARRPGAKHKK